MAVDKKFFVDINLQGNALNNATIGSNSDMTKGGSFQYNGTRLEYYNGSVVQLVANMNDISAVTGGLIFQGGYDPTTNIPDIADGTAKKGYFWVATAAGTFLGEAVQVGDSLIATVNDAGASIGDWLILQGNVVIATDTVDGIVRLATQEEVNNGVEGGGAVVLTPATFENSQQLADINNSIKELGDDKLAIDGSQAMTGDLNMDSHKVINVLTPTSANDAANKGYADDVARTARESAESYADTGLALKLDLAGGTMTGSLDMGGNDISNVNAITVSGGIDMGSSDISNANTITANSVNTNGLTVNAGGNIYTNESPIHDAVLANSLDANDNTIKKLANPTNAQDAATKAYVDTRSAVFSETFVAADWTYDGSKGYYSVQVAHNIDSPTPKVSSYVSGNLVEFAVEVSDANTIVLKSNIAAPASVSVGVSK
jgi:hypothetical protein